MTSREPESLDPPRSPTPLDYVDPHIPELEQDQPQEPDGNPGNDHGSPDANPDPGDPDNNDNNNDDDDPLTIPTPFLHQPTIAQKVTDSLKPLSISRVVFKTSAETPHQSPRKSRLESLTPLTAPTLGNFVTSLSSVI